jgi:hypothetical protein
MSDLFVPNNPRRDRALELGRIRLICSIAQGLFISHYPKLCESAAIEGDFDEEDIALDAAEAFVNEIDKRYPQLADLAE